MARYSKRSRSTPFVHGIGGIIVALICVITLIGCSSGKSETIIVKAPATTEGSLNVKVTPASSAVVVTGPNNYRNTFQGNDAMDKLKPGDYTVDATADGYVAGSKSVHVFAGQTASVLLVLGETPIISESPRAVYRDGAGNLIPIDATTLQSGKFVFYAWLQDRPLGIVTENMTATATIDPGKPLVVEQAETAPSFTQNLAGAWVGFMDDTGIVRPVIGADVRWEIDQQYAQRIPGNGSTQFGTSDDNRVALGYGVSDDQADTRTNNARLAAERFPLIVTEYPLYNMTGVGAPFIDGFTWVTLFSPDTAATARIVAVATVNGEEIGKQILIKKFAPAPAIDIVKTVDQALVNLDVSNTVTWTVTVRNTGTGEATTIDLNDFLVGGDSGNYTIVAPPGSTQVGDGFTYTIGPISAPGAVAPEQNTQLLGNAWNFAVLANATVTNTGPSVINGHVGVSAGTAVTGFPPGTVLNGTIHNNDAASVAAQTSLTAAWDAITAMPCTTGPVGVTDIGNTTVLPGVHCYSSSLALTGPVVLDAQGDPNAQFFFKMGSTLTTAASASVSLINGANPCNVYWQVGSSATLGANSFFVGSVLAQASITAVTGTNISGRAHARVGTVTMDTNAINAPLACVTAPGNEQTFTFTATVDAPGTYCNEVQVLSYDNATDTWTPVDLGDQACFTAVESNLTLVKDFVADDNTTSLGKSVTVAANVPAKLRVRVINSGTGDATGVDVNDVFAQALSTGLLANYKLISVAPGTMNDADLSGVNDGFTNAIGTLAQGATATMLLSVSASTDGVYCDTATVTATVGTIGIGSDTACLTVATPDLTIVKTESPTSVLPGATYTSTIVVENVGNATARNVVIKDLIGLNDLANVRAIYVSSSLNGAGGTLANNIVTSGSVDIPAGGTMTFTVVSRIPIGAASGTYCDTATVTSSNAVTREDTACVTVPAFSALQTQLIDLADPVSAGSSLSYFSVMYVEALSNEGVSNTVLTYSFGLDNPVNIGQAGSFQVTGTRVYLDTKPVRDPNTGLVVSDTTNATATLLTENVDYTLVTTAPGGKQVITMSTGVVLQPNTALYVVNDVLVPGTVVVNKMYTTSYIWESTGLISTTNYTASSSEPTTVLP